MKWFINKDLSYMNDWYGCIITPQGIRLTTKLILNNIFSLLGVIISQECICNIMFNTVYNVFRSLGCAFIATASSSINCI